MRKPLRIAHYLPKDTSNAVDPHSQILDLARAIGRAIARIDHDRDHMDTTTGQTDDRRPR